MEYDYDQIKRMIDLTVIRADGCWSHPHAAVRYAWDYEVDEKPYPVYGTPARVWYYWSRRIFPISDRTLQVRHLCPNRKCCNPAHLILGTATENRLDEKYPWDHPRFSTLKEQAELELRGVM